MAGNTDIVKGRIKEAAGALGKLAHFVTSSVLIVQVVRKCAAGIASASTS